MTRDDHRAPLARAGARAHARDPKPHRTLARTLLVTILLSVVPFLLAPRLASADESFYVPASLDVSHAPTWVVGFATTRTDETALAPNAARDQLFGISVARLIVPFEIAALVSFGPNPWEGIDRVRLHGALLGRVSLNLFSMDTVSIALRYGAGASLELRYNDDYWLAHVVPAELSIVLGTDNGWRFELSGALRVAVGGEVVDSIVLDAMGVSEDTSKPRLESILGNPAGYSISIVMGRTL